MQQVLPTTFKGRGKWRLLADWMNRIGRIINGMTGYDGIDIEFVGDDCRIFYRGASAQSPQEKRAFAWLGTSNNTVTIGEGYVEGRFGYYTIPQTVVTAGGNKNAKHLIIASGSDSSGAIEPYSVAEADFTGDTSHTWRRALYRVYMENGRVVLDRVCAGVGGIVL